MRLPQRGDLVRLHHNGMFGLVLGLVRPDGWRQFIVALANGTMVELDKREFRDVPATCPGDDQIANFAQWLRSDIAPAAATPEPTPELEEPTP